MSITPEMTWSEALEILGAREELRIRLNRHRRRTSKNKRAQGLVEERSVWRLLLQHRTPERTKTLLRKNLGSGEDPIHARQLSERDALVLERVLERSKSSFR